MAAASWTSSHFPKLKEGNFRITSRKTRSYNCIAWAAGDETRWWEPDVQGNFYRPADAPRARTMASYLQAYSTDYGKQVRQRGTAFIGKCSSGISTDIAQELLDTGFKYPTEDDPPNRIYNVHAGVIYEAVCSGDDAWHGYPWRARPGKSPLPASIMKGLQQRASEQGFPKEYKEWVKRYGS